MKTYLTTQQCRTALLFVRFHSSLYRRLSRNLAREIASYMGDPFLLPKCIGQTISVLYLEKGSRRQKTVDLQMTWDTVNCLLDWRTIFFISHAPLCCKVDLISFEVIQVAPMHIPRENPGAIHVKGVVYVFGGKRSDLLTSSEKYQLSNNEWSPLPPLPTPKYAFNPCQREDQIFLAEVNNSLHSFDIFNLVQATYRSLPFKIQCGKNGCVSFIVGEELYLLTMQQQCLKWNLKQVEAQPTQSQVQLVEENDAYSSCTPVFFRGVVYWTNYLSGKTVSFDSSTQLLKEEAESEEFICTETAAC